MRWIKVSKWTCLGEAAAVYVNTLAIKCIMPSFSIYMRWTNIINISLNDERAASRRLLRFWWSTETDFVMLRHELPGKCQRLCVGEKGCRVVPAKFNTQTQTLIYLSIWLHLSRATRAYYKVNSALSPISIVSPGPGRIYSDTNDRSVKFLCYPRVGFHY